VYESGLRIAHYNTRCSENSYNREVDCYQHPEARYSYQFGIGAIHTSNFHPCKDIAFTGRMRQRFLEALGDNGFATDAGVVTADVLEEFHEICPDSTPSAVDYYILTAHRTFDIPQDGSGNYLEGYGRFPFFAPRVSISLTFGELLARASSIDSDRKAIQIFGGGDSAYSTTARQNEVLSYFENFRRDNCQ